MPVEPSAPVPASRPAPAGGFDVRRYLFGPAAVLAGTANVVLQLSRPAVGYGVLDSPVESGSAMKHPLKRTRTTFTYLAVALLGDPDDRAAFRRAVDRQHAQVVSTPASPVPYRALDPELQLWVAACLCFGTFDVVEKLHGPLPPSEADALYAHCARFGTTLQVRPEQWPADRQAFADYWRRGLAAARLDEPVRRYLLALVRLENLPAWLGRPLAGFSTFVTTGFLPPELRAALGLRWDPTRQRRLERLLQLLGRVDRRLPTALRILPFNVLLADMRRRRRRGRPLV